MEIGEWAAKAQPVGRNSRAIRNYKWPESQALFKMQTFLTKGDWIEIANSKIIKLVAYSSEGNPSKEEWDHYAYLARWRYGT